MSFRSLYYCYKPKKKSHWYIIIERFILEENSFSSREDWSNYYYSYFASYSAYCYKLIDRSKSHL